MACGNYTNKLLRQHINPKVNIKIAGIMNHCP